MTLDEKYQTFKTMLSEDVDEDVFQIYLRLAKQKILNHRFPYGTELVEVEQRYELDEIELAIVLYNQRGVEGQKSHNENGINRQWRTEQEILQSIPRMVGIPR